MARDDGNEKSEKVSLPGVAFDFGKVTVLEWAEMVDMVNDLTLSTLERVQRQSAFLAKVVAALPVGWGEPADPQTYTRLRNFDQFEPLVQAMWGAVEDERKKARTRSTTR